MRKIFALAIVIVIFSGSTLFAQNYDEDDRPYLSEEDIKSIEMMLSYDVPKDIVELNKPEETEKEVPLEKVVIVEKEIIFEKEIQIQNEIVRLNNSRKKYHLMILDRRYCNPETGIGDINEINILYQFGSLGNGYFLLLYEVPEKGPVFPILPDGSFIILDLMTNRINTIREYVNSDLFLRFISHRQALYELGRVLEKL